MLLAATNEIKVTQIPAIKRLVPARVGYNISVDWFRACWPNLPMSKQDYSTTPVDLKTKGADTTGESVDLPRQSTRRRTVWAVLLLTLIVVVAWFFGVPSSFLKSQALRQLQRGNPDQARSWLTWAGKLNRADGEVEFLTARSYRIQGDMNQARSHLKKAWHLGFSVAKLEREQLLAMAQSGQLKEAEPALPGMLADPRGDSADICEAFVTGYLKTYRLGKAEGLLTAWLADSPKQPRALLLRAKMQIELVNWKSAEENLQRVMTEIPEHAEAADLLAGVLLKQKRPDEAQKILPVAVKDPRTRLSAWLRQVECYRILGQEQPARSLLQSILKEYPESMQAHLDLGSLESDAGSFGPALIELERAHELAPNSPEVRYALAIALRGAGNVAEAKEHFEYVTRAREAVVEVMKLRSKIEKEPDNAEIRCRIGTTLLDYGQTERGLVWLHSALEANTRLVSAHQRLAQYYASRAKESDDFAELAAEHRKLATAP
jgi:Tfp pilus assembly protein PilF